MPLQLRRRGLYVRVGAGVALTALLAGCSGAGGASSSGGGGDTLNVLMVNNPQMIELQKLTAANFTKDTGIKVNFTVLPENDVRDKITQDFSNQAGQYDVATISNYEVPFYAKNGWLHPSTTTSPRTRRSIRATSSSRCRNPSRRRTASSTPNRSTASRPS